MLSVESLPLEILGHICDLLSASDYPISVGHLACTSKRWYQVAGSRRFAQISITIRTRQQLQAAVTRWVEILHRNAAFTAVRSLTLRGDLPRAEVASQYEGKWDQVVDLERWVPVDALTCIGSRYARGLKSLPQEKATIEHESLTDVPALVCRLSGLRDLYWSCTFLLPPSLLEVLHHKPGPTNCRLHMLVFKLPSLHQHPQQLHDIDPYEWSLATSPCLHTVAVPVTTYDYYGNFEYNGEAVRELVKIAPSLSHVHIITERPNYGSMPFPHLLRGRPTWPGFFKDPQHQEQARQALTRPPTSIGHLTSLSLNPAKKVDEIRAWQTHTVFSSLRTLHLWNVSRSVLLAAAACPFSALQVLAIDPAFQWDIGEDEVEVDEETSRSAQQLGDQATMTFIQSLRPGTLREVHLSTGTTASMSPRKAIAAIIQHHGAALHTLSLTDSGGYITLNPDADPITLSQIEQIQASCPNLRDFRVPIRRQKGNADEVAIYQALGRFSQLRDLTLRLECITREPPHEPPHGPPYEPLHEPDTEKVRDLMINSAVDSRLIEEIFTVVAQAQSSAALQRLHVEVVNNIPTYLGDILNNLGRRWYCFRLYPSRDSGVELRVQEILNEHWLFQRYDDQELDEYESVFRSLWPLQTDRWRLDWRSFPLATIERRPEIS